LHPFELSSPLWPQQSSLNIKISIVEDVMPSTGPQRDDTFVVYQFRTIVYLVPVSYIAPILEGFLSRRQNAAPPSRPGISICPNCMRCLAYLRVQLMPAFAPGVLSRLVNAPALRARPARFGSVWVGDAGDFVVDVNVYFTDWDKKLRVVRDAGRRGSSGRSRLEFRPRRFVRSLSARSL
jgi:hypothetical protein